jgi:hypothetical protein
MYTFKLIPKRCIPCSYNFFNMVKRNYGLTCIIVVVLSTYLPWRVGHGGLWKGVI